jgi:hypothetical protein
LSKNGKKLGGRRERSGGCKEEANGKEEERKKGEDISSTRKRI